MAERIKVIATAIFVGSFLMVPLLAILQQSELVEAMPEAEGKQLVASICAGCHTLDTVLMMRRSKEDWESTVANMISRGAQIFTDETATIVNYLAEHYAPQAASGSSDSTAAGASAPTGLFAEKCFQCHGDTMWRDLRTDRRGWEGTLYRMVGRGALWTEEEISAMADYLVENYGPE